MRIEGDEEDALLAGFARAALDLFERFTGQVALIGERAARIPCDGGWHRLTPTPVKRLVAVDGLAAGGSALPVPSDAIELQIDFCGDGWARCSAAEPVAARLTVEAGLAEDWNGLPEAVRQGLMRLAAHFYANRDRADEVGPPAAIAALWRPWRRMRLS